MIITFCGHSKLYNTDIIKDRLYCDKTDGLSRRSAQTTIYTIIHAFTRLIAPILAFTSEEIWSFLPHTDKEDVRSVLLSDMPTAIDLPDDPEFLKKWENISYLRELAQKALEQKRTDKVIGSSLEAELIIYPQKESFDFWNSVTSILSEVCLVSNVLVSQTGEGETKADDGSISISVKKAETQKCERCWSYRETVGSSDKHPTLCKRCVEVLED